MYKLTNLLCVLFIASFINAGILFFSSVHWWIPCSRTETSNVASLRYTLRFLPYLFAYCATPLLPMFHWWENEGQEPPGDILMMTQWARWQEKKNLLTASPILCLNPSSILPHFYYAIKWITVYEFIPRHIIAFISHQRAWDRQKI